MIINHKGEVIDFKIYESIINSKIKMTYKNVNQILENNMVPEGYENFIGDIRRLDVVSKLLRNKREKSGLIDFNIKENKITLDAEGRAKEITLRYRGKAEKLIEEFMIETGKQSSIYLDNSQKNCKTNTHVYRNHDIPNEEKIELFIKYLASLGEKKRAACLKELTTKEIQNLLYNIKDLKERPILERELLKCMSKAVYSTANKGHFALVLDTYCQTTSPIRRSGDLLNHILIKENIYKKQNIDFKSNLSSYAETASIKERNASECEKEATKVKTVEYMQNHIGEEFEGTITGMAKYGMYVELPNLVEGMINIKAMDDDFYEFDKEKYIFKGRTHKRIYHLGDKINIIVRSVSKENKTIDFVINDKNPNKTKKKGKFDRYY